MQFCIQLNIDIWEITLYLQANPHGLKTKNINSFTFISTIVKQLMLMFFLFYRLGLFQERKEKSLLYIDVLFHKVII